MDQILLELKEWGGILVIMYHSYLTPDWTGLCFVVLNPRVLQAKRVDFGLFFFVFFIILLYKFPILLPPDMPPKWILSLSGGLFE